VGTGQGGLLVARLAVSGELVLRPAVGVEPVDRLPLVALVAQLATFAVACRRVHGWLQRSERNALPLLSVVPSAQTLRARPVPACVEGASDGLSKGHAEVCGARRTGTFPAPVVAVAVEAVDPRDPASFNRAGILVHVDSFTVVHASGVFQHPPGLFCDHSTVTSGRRGRVRSPCTSGRPGPPAWSARRGRGAWPGVP